MVRRERSNLRPIASLVIASVVLPNFTLDEANDLLSDIRPHLARSVQMWVRLAGLARALEVEAAKIHEPYDETKLRGRPDLREELEQARLVASLIAEDAAVITALGASIHDGDRSLVGFPTVVDGEREVLLCWRLGERDIRFFREPGVGIEGRTPTEGHRFFRSRQLRAPNE
jgi:hypothetical protein